MLVLGRRVNEEFRISHEGKELWVKVLEIRGSYHNPEVKIGIRGDRDMQVLRSEVIHRADEYTREDQD